MNDKLNSFERESRLGFQRRIQPPIRVSQPPSSKIRVPASVSSRRQPPIRVPAIPTLLGSFQKVIQKDYVEFEDETLDKSGESVTPEVVFDSGSTGVDTDDDSASGSIGNDSESNDNGSNGSESSEEEEDSTSSVQSSSISGSSVPQPETGSEGLPELQYHLTKANISSPTANSNSPSAPCPLDSISIIQ
ncbi:hypothetical protein E3N88_09747 [Mikania micrantha]|uniref:Uncharacterized protein n=1 Tax=Mikania micrantha TaxID=192012 RepID=A0A5N6PLY6_9ASTR|nr:hypothetical protein E3N88_09747 [Mikania micrantha]